MNPLISFYHKQRRLLEKVNPVIKTNIGAVKRPSFYKEQLGMLQELYLLDTLQHDVQQQQQLQQEFDQYVTLLISQKDNPDYLDQIEALLESYPTLSKEFE